MNDNLLSVSTERDLLTGKVRTNTFVKVYETIFTSGIVARLGSQGFTTLLALATFMNEEGECYPTQEQVAERIGCHRNTANRYINDLLAIRIEGKPVISRQVINRGGGKISSYYKIHPISQLTKFKGKIEDVDIVMHKGKVTDGSDDKSTDGSAIKSSPVCAVIRSTEKNQDNKIKNSEGVKPLNSKTAIQYFQEVYREVYGVNYTVGNYARDGKLIRDKLIVPHGDKAKEIIDVAVRQYASRWKSAKFPRPTISMFTWVTNQVLDILAVDEEIDKVAAAADEVEAKAEAEMLARLEQWGN